MARIRARYKARKNTLGKVSCYNLVAYWTLRAFIFSPALVDEIEIDSYRRSEKVCEFLQAIFGDLLTVKEEKSGYIKLLFAKEQLFKSTQEFLKKYKVKAWDIEPELLRNLKTIKKIFGLSEAEEKVLTFAVVADVVPIFREIMDIFGEVNMSEFIEKVSKIIEVEKDELSQALSYNSTLLKTGLLSLNSYEVCYIGERLELLRGLSDELFLSYENPEKIFNNYIQKARPTEFTRKDFSHIEEVETLISYLKNTIKSREKGVNILFYGPPGTGKTELAKLIAKEAGGELWEVVLTNKKGEPLEEMERFSCYRLAQFLLRKKQNAVLLFDEVDDILDVSSRVVFSLSRRNKEEGDAINKAWINRLLEENEVPTIWITNSILGADSAYLRRFDIVLQVDYLPRSARMRILKKYFKDFPISEEWFKKMSEIKYLFPAVVAKAAKVAAFSKSENPENVAEFVITSSLKALGFREEVKHESQDKLPFIEDVLNTNWEVKKLISALKCFQRGRLLFYGPPGTGKTEFAKQLAIQLNKELLLKRASDLISPYVGATEINIARMFREAKQEKAVLLLDEADTFLLSRKDAKYSWEISMVNELLTQMEAFEGVFICATNFINALDEAVMRRFDFKVKFDYLNDAQKLKLFASLFGKKEAEKYQKELSKLLLTPGNFATAYRKLKLIDELSPKAFIKALSEEAKFNEPSKRKNLGFV